jgi:poly(A) polymerase
MEMLKLLRAAHAAPTLAVMAETGLLEQVLAGVPLLASFENTCKVEQAIGLEADPVRRLGALAVSVAEDAERLWQRLRLTNSEHARLLSIADHWSWASPARGEGPSRELIYRIGPDRYVDCVLVAWARSPAGAADEDWKNLATLPARWSAPKFPLKAKDLIKRGVEKGPRLGAALAGAEQAWIAAGFPLDPRALAALADAAVAATDARPAGDGP